MSIEIKVTIWFNAIFLSFDHHHAVFTGTTIELGMEHNP